MNTLIRSLALLAALALPACVCAPADLPDGAEAEPPASTLPDRACYYPDESACVTQPALSLTEYGCEEIVNRSGIPGARAWCCAPDAIPSN